MRPVIGDVQADNYRAYYNTYNCSGLPAGAICNPGEDAIKAALYPDSTDYYYFQHDNRGNIYLARTNAEHNRYRSEIAWKTSIPSRSSRCVTRSRFSPFSSRNG